jgi:hypothetical protein
LLSHIPPLGPIIGEEYPALTAAAFLPQSVEAALDVRVVNACLDDFERPLVGEHRSGYTGGDLKENPLRLLRG